MIAALNPEDEPQDYLSADDLPDPYATLDVDMAGDPEPDAFAPEVAPNSAPESARQRKAREYEQALAPYLEKHVKPLSEYVIDVAAGEAMIGGSADDLAARGEAILAEAKSQRATAMLLIREYAEQDYRRTLLEATALEALKQDETKDGDKR